MSRNFQVSQSSIDTIVSMVAAQPGITLVELFEYAEGVSRDEIYFMIVYSIIFVNLSADPLVEPDRCLVFRDEQTANAYSCLTLSQVTSGMIASPSIDLVPGTPITYDGKCLTLALVGETSILLQTENGDPVELGLEAFDRLLQQGKISSLQTANEESFSSEMMAIFKSASEDDLKDANRRYHLIQPYLNGEPVETGTKFERSIRNWLKAFREAQRKYGYGYLGLIHVAASKGNRNRKIPASTLEIMENFIEKKYENKKQKRKYEAYAQFVSYCAEQGLPDDLIPSYKSFIAEVKRRSGHQQTLVRAGHRAAYDLEPPYWNLELTTPRHGDFPFHYAYIDHTQVDDELRCSRTGKNLGRPWVTFLIDAFTRRILTVYITYDEPSYRSCMMVLRICVMRFGRVPQTLIVDNGQEFHSTYFQATLALLYCTVKYRPSAKSRFSAVCERLFGTANTQFFHTLAGNTQITKKVRLMTKSVNPKELSLWTIGLLYCYLCEWAYEVYDTTDHPALGQSPREAFTDGISQFGQRGHRRIPYNQDFRILTLPGTNNGSAKVQPGKGVKYEHKYYWSNAFRDPEIAGTWVDLRYEPFNAGVVYAYVRGQWVECISEYYALFRGRSEKEIQKASEELRQRFKNHARNYKIRAKQLGQFLTSIEAQEVLLEQRLRDEQQQEVFGVLEGGMPNLTPYSPNRQNSNSQNLANTVQASHTQQSESPLQQSEPSQPPRKSERQRFKSY